MASGNHYTRQVQQLEALLNSKLKQISVLEDEHQLLVDKEKVLQNAIHSIEGPLALVTESLGAGSSGGTAAGPVIAGNPETAVAALAAACDCDFLSDSSLTENSSPYVSGDAGVVLDQPGTPTTSAGSRVAAASNLAAAPYKGGSALLQQIINREGKVQRVLQQLGCCDDVSYRQLYTTELLRKAVSDPVRMAGYLSMPKEERLKYWSQAYCQMALLLGKYDSNMNLAAGNVRQQVDYLVDELLERVVVCAQLDPPSKHMSCFMFNVDTQEFEPYPEGWWAQVVEGMQLSVQDRAALKLVWDRIQVSTRRLAQEWEEMQRQLQQLQRQQLQSNKRIERAFKELPSLLQTLTVAERARQQDRLSQQTQRQQQQQALAQHALAAQSLNEAHPGHPSQLCMLKQQMDLAQAQLATLQQQQQQQQQHLTAPLQQLHDAWQLETNQQHAYHPQAHLMVDQCIAEIAADLVRQPAPQQAQQPQPPMGWTGTGHYSPDAAGQAAMLGVGVGTTAYICPEVPGMVLGQQPMPAGAHYSSPSVGQGSVLQAQPAGGHSSPGGGRVGSGASGGSGPADACSGSFVQPGSSGARASPSAGPPAAAAAAADGSFTQLQEEEEVLLQDGTQERQRMEHALQACTNKIKVLNYCMLLHFTNTLTKKQLAAMCVHSHPFVFDVHSMCEALDQVGWGC